MAKGDAPVVSSGFSSAAFAAEWKLIRFSTLQVPGEVEGEAAPAGKKTVETVKAVSVLLFLNS